jgi:hypothetical protein
LVISFIFHAAARRARQQREKSTVSRCDAN